MSKIHNFGGIEFLEEYTHFRKPIETSQILKLFNKGFTLMNFGTSYVYLDDGDFVIPPAGQMIIAPDAAMIQNDSFKVSFRDDDDVASDPDCELKNLLLVREQLINHDEFKTCRKNTCGL